CYGHAKRLAEQGHGADCLKLKRSVGFRQRLMPGGSAPQKVATIASKGGRQMALPIRQGERDIMTDHVDTQRIHGYCGLCRASCGTVATVEDGRFIRLDPDPAHPTGQAICAKGRAAPELVYHPERLTHPLRRTRPKGEADPGWERI